MNYSFYDSVIRIAAYLRSAYFISLSSFVVADSKRVLSKQIPEVFTRIFL